MRSTKANYFNSPSLPYTNGSYLTFTHQWANFDYTIDCITVQVWGLCIANDAGWKVGDSVSIENGVSIVLTGNTIGLQINSKGLSVVSGNNGNIATIKPNNWELYITGIREKTRN